MAWEGYITNLLASGNLEKAAIFSKVGDDWIHCASSPGFDISAEEVKSLLKDESTLHSTGARMNKLKYFYLRTEGNYCNFKCTKNEQGETPHATVGKSIKTLVIGVGKGHTPGGQVCTEVFKVCDYLEKCGC